MTQSATITRQDLHDSAKLFAKMHGAPTFRTRDFTAFTGMAALWLDEELANELLLEVVAAGDLREVGPGVYALADGSAVELQAPLWPEDGPQ